MNPDFPKAIATRREEAISAPRDGPAGGSEKNQLLHSR